MIIFYGILSVYGLAFGLIGASNLIDWLRNRKAANKHRNTALRNSLALTNGPKRYY